MNKVKSTSKFWFQCSHCGKEYDRNEVLYLCPSCIKKNTEDSPPFGVLKTLYNYEKIRSGSDGFEGLTPLNDVGNLPNLRIGNTPIYQVNALNNNTLPFKLHLKDDSQNPTYSFKDRASALVCAVAKERGFETIITASTGNAGSSLAGICAYMGQKAIVLVPEAAPLAKITQILMYGGRIVPVKGNYDDAFDLSIKASDEFGWYNRNTAYNPFTIEGKKTVAFELYSQLNNSIPDRIFIPVGDGVILSGVYKGFEDLMSLGLIDRMPVLIAVQSKGSDNLVRNLETEEFVVKESHTLADSISVDIPRNFHMAKEFIRKYGGLGISVSDEEISKAAYLLASQYGLFTEPASAAAFAGFLAYKDKYLINDNSTNIVLLTGSGLKDLPAAQNSIKVPGSINPDLDALTEFLA